MYFNYKNIIVEPEFDQILESNLSNNIFTLFEVSMERMAILKQIDIDFLKLSKDYKDKIALKNLINHIKEFTGVKKIRIRFDIQEDSAYVIPEYNNYLPRDYNIINIFTGKEVEGQEPKELDGKAPEYIDGMYIVFGTKFLNMITNREATAVLLHELGHVYAHTSNFQNIFVSTIRKISKLVSFIGILSTIKFIFAGALTLTPLFAIISFFFFLLTRSLSFIEHVGEYHADEFAIRYGYGDELTKVMFKVHDIETDGNVKSKTFFHRIIRFIKFLLNIKTHPETEERICNLVNTMKDDYKAQYPKLNNELNIVLSNIKC